MGLRYDGRKIGKDAGKVGDQWEAKAEFIEHVGGGAQDEA